MQRLILLAWPINSMKTIQKTIIGFLLVILVSSSLFLATPKPAQAIFPVGDITTVTIDLNGFFRDLAEAVLSTILTTTANSFTNKFLGQAITKYKVNSYFGYTRNLENQIGVTEQLNGKTSTDAYILRSAIQDIQGLAGSGNANLTPLYNKQALNAMTIYNPPTTNAANNFLMMAKMANPNTSPQGVQLAYISQANQLYSNAQQSALTEIGASNGLKSSYTGCSSASSSSSSSSSSIVSTSSCAVQNPSRYVDNQISNEIGSLLNVSKNPADHVQAIAFFLGNTLGRVLQSKLLGTSGPSSGKVLSDTVSAAGALASENAAENDSNP